MLAAVGPALRADLRRRRLDRRHRGAARGRSRRATPSTSGSRSCGATAARPPHSRRRSTWRGATSSCRWTATARTTRPTSPGCSSGSTRATTSSRAGGRTGRTRSSRRKIPSQIANRLVARISGVPLHDFGCTLKAYRRARARRRAALRRDAPVHPDLRRLARGAGHRAGRQPPPPHRRQDQVRAGPDVQRRARPDPDPLLPALRPAADPLLRPDRALVDSRWASLCFVAMLYFKYVFPWPSLWPATGRRRRSSRPPCPSLTVMFFLAGVHEHPAWASWPR